jgi:uncharacterized membrane protein
VDLADADALVQFLTNYAANHSFIFFLVEVADRWLALHAFSRLILFLLFRIIRIGLCDGILWILHDIMGFLFGFGRFACKIVDKYLMNSFKTP